MAKVDDAAGNRPETSTLYTVDATTNPFALVPIADTGASINAAGYNPVDNFIYAVDENFDLVQMGADGVPVSTGVNVGSANSGGIDDTGLLTLRESGDGQPLRTYDLNDLTLSPTVGPTSWTRTADFAYNPVNDRLYSVLSTGEVVRVSLTTGNRVAVSVPGDTLPATLYGGQFFDADGNFFAYANTGGFYRIEIGNGNGTGASPAAEVTLVSDAAISGSNDGASCPAPPPSAAPGVAKAMSVTGTGTWETTIDYEIENFGDDILGWRTPNEALATIIATHTLATTT